MTHAAASNLSARGAAVFAAAFALAGGGTALAQPAQVSQTQPAAPPAQGLMQRPQNQNATRYATPDGAVRFVFDRSFGGNVALVRFEGDPEVHILRPVAGAGGDEIYSTESGDVQLRASRHGGVTVYTRNHRTGAPAAEEGQVDRLTPQEVALAAYRARLAQLQALAARRIGAPVTIETPVPTNGAYAGVLLDAAERATQGLSEAPLTGVRRVVITIGPQPRAALRGESLSIQVAPQLGFAGRPSSNTIRNVATGQVHGPEQ